MKRYIIFYILTAVTTLQGKTFAQEQNRKDTSSETTKVLVRDVPEMFGGYYRKREARGFYALSGNDTSKFLCIFQELKAGQVIMTLRWTTTKTFSEQLAELAKLLPKAKKEFDFDSLTGISAGLLFEMGDMDIQVTKEVLAASQNNYNFTARQAAKYLMKTQLAKDFNTLLKPYNLSIASFGTPEQAYFNEKKYLISRSSGKITGSKLETPINKIPEKLFDCDVAMKLKKV